ncbi:MULTISPECIES: Nramp family divalent metal transporter [Clostridium]|uniref:Divalent metal cation transporter MntH n=3 Tax=Clostridium TaxID=1485 RepID=D8GJT9_CLOLD|nr:MULTISPECIES: Nramp family divalent metal transporter [Clostridium]ADK17241.1 putative divalent cation transporter, NRAMP family [Clostridium ljungdahlii DSM 13528]AGY76283.1 Nramp family divalent metal transporter [Clostridium autoethanogenum DSM 10061]ALU36443.1 Natural resistance-associated macrophage protein [Clostridium autoethanogenum DSM 10061]OAA84581.1 Divalent metal cation transporter MntH [Clostridium ljungdahlii DSM 13528]OVY48985.1 Divalent metal cation transporter MntH [Clostr
MKKKNKFLLILSIIGPGLITVNAGNDAGGITTYATVGASYGYNMLWGLLLITFSLSVIQEMNARMAVVTGKGLSDLIRENFSVKLAFFAMIILFVANFGVCVGDFAGIAASMDMFGINKYISVPIMAFVVWFLITKGSYSNIEKIFLAFTFVFFSYIITCFIEKPDWNHVIRATFTPTLKFDSGFILAFIGMIGTTITPYMQFYLQSSVVDKGLQIKDYKYEKLDVYLGSIWGNLVAFFIIICTAVTLYKAGIKIDSASQAAQALKPLAGNYASILFGVGLFGASVLACMVIPLSTSYAICECFGLESGLDHKYKESPAFYGIFTFMIIFSSIIVLIPNVSLVGVMLITQQLAGILCPIILIFMVLLTNNKELMGEYVNNGLQNIIIWVTVIFIIVLSVILFVSPFIKI